MTSTPPAAPFLRLPIELRYAIYDYLCVPDFQSYPYGSSSPIAAINVSGPPLPLLLCNQHLYAELSTYYFSRCTFRFVAQSFSRGASAPSASTLSIIRRITKVELLLLPGATKVAARSAPQTAIGVKQMSPQWLVEQVGLLRDEARCLERVTVSMGREDWDCEWNAREEMETLLRPLRELRGRVEFRVGIVVGPEQMERIMNTELKLGLERLND